MINKNESCPISKFVSPNNSIEYKKKYTHD